MSKEDFIKHFVANYMSRWCLEYGSNPWGYHPDNFREALENEI